MPWNTERNLEELLSDPVARLVMERDGWTKDQVATFFQSVQRKALSEPGEGRPEDNVAAEFNPLMAA